jgi:hypothetical protein
MIKLGTIYKNIESHQKAIAKRRDKLDEFIDELSGLRECCDQAWNDLQSARDSLSEYV